MKTAKKSLLFLIGLVALISGTSYAATLQGGNFNALNGSSQWFFDQTSESTPLSQAQCSEYRVEKNYYLPGDINGDWIKDENTSTYLRDNFVVQWGTYPLYLISTRGTGFIGTQVRYYLPEANVLNVINWTSLMSLNAKNAWFRYSKVAPTNQWVRAIESEPMLLSAPQSWNPQNNKLQVAYNIMYRWFSSKGTATSDYATWPVSSATDFWPLFLNSNRWALNANWTVAPRWQADYTKTANIITTASINWEKTETAHWYECFNVTTHWCGDGVVDNKTFDNVWASEQCDLGAQNGKPGSLCTPTCTTIIKPEIPDVSIVKSVVWNPAWYITGDTITYKLIVRNIGTGNATNVVVADQLPFGVSYSAGSTRFSNWTAIEPIYNATSNTLRWNMGNMPAWYYNEITFTVTLNTAPFCAPFKNDATIAPDARDGETNTTNNSSTATFYSSCDNPDVITSKKVEAISGSYLPGQTVKYTLTYKNQGAGIANGVAVTDTLPSNVTYIANSSLSNPDIGQPTVNGNKLTWNIGTLAPNAGGTITIFAKIATTVPMCSALKIHNDFTISATNEPDTLLENNPSWADFYIWCVDLWSTKEVDKAMVATGETLTYTINYGNSWTVVWPAVVTDILPLKTEYILNSATSTPNVGQPTVNGQTLTWNVGTLQPGARGTITIKAKIPGPVQGNEEYINKVCITDDNNFNNNNCDEAITKTNPYFDLSIDKNPKSRDVTLGDEFDYTLTVQNKGTVGVNGFSVKDYLPKGLEYVSSSNNGTYTASTKTIVWNDLNIGAVGSFTLTVKVKYVWPISNGTETNYTEICNYNGVGNGNGQNTTKPHDIDSNPCNGTGNNEDDTSKGVINPVEKPYFDLSIDKNPKLRQVKLGDEFDYTLSVSNNGTVWVNEFSVKDYLPKWLEYVSSSNNGTYTASTKTIVWNDLSIGAVGTFNLTVKVKYVWPITNGTETNYTEICNYNGLGSGNGQDATKPHDIDSNPCNGTGNTEDDTSKGVIIPPTTSPYFDLSIDKLVKLSTQTTWKKSVQAHSGDLIDFSLVVKNEWPETASNFTVKDYLPAGFVFKQASANSKYVSNTAGDAAPGTLIWTGLTLKAWETTTLTFKATYVDEVTRTNYTEICDYNGMWQDTTKPYDIDSIPCNGTGNTEDDTSKASVNPINDYFDLALDKLINNSKSLTDVQKGTEVMITLNVSNTGGVVWVSGFSVKDYMPADLEYKEGSTLVNWSLTAATAVYSWGNRQLLISNLTIPARGTLSITFKATYNGTTTRINYAEICDYNGNKTYTGEDPKDIDSDPCNRGANEDDESSAQISPYTSGGGCTVNCGWSTNYYCGDGIVHRPNSRGVYEICDEWNLSNTSDPFRFGSGAVITQWALKGRFCYWPKSNYPCQVKAVPENVDAPTCGYIDPPSIQANEYLPFRWELESKKKGMGISDSDFSDCTSWEIAPTTNNTFIKKSSVKCKFIVRDATNVISQSEEYCFNTYSQPLVESAFSSILKSMWYKPEEYPTPAWFAAEKLKFKNLGEHSIEMKVSSYKTCHINASWYFNNEFSEATPTPQMERVCQMNFVVTKPYMVSRGALGDFATDPLTSFFQFPEGKPVFTTWLPALTTNYNPTTEVTTAVDKLIADYQKIAVKADGATFRSNEGSNVTVYKVPNKEVYIFSPENEKATITVGDKTTSPTKAFTLILTKGTLNVKGNLQSNGMFIVQKGNIHFSPIDCNTPQEVNGIFISLKDITSDAWFGSERQSAHNIDLSKEWCNEWNITINGILIGGNIRNWNVSDSLLATRRSNVNSWFADMYQWLEQSDERQNALKNYGAVVLKYNPTIFNNLPPGADTLAEILNVYKK